MHIAHLGLFRVRSRFGWTEKEVWTRTIGANSRTVRFFVLCSVCHWAFDAILLLRWVVLFSP